MRFISSKIRERKGLTTPECIAARHPRVCPGRNNAQRVVGTEPCIKFFSMKASAVCPLRRCILLSLRHPVASLPAFEGTVAVKNRRHSVFLLSRVVFRISISLSRAWSRSLCASSARKSHAKNNIVAVNDEFLSFQVSVQTSVRR